jgi:2-oxoglutarate ferredoxin oxidoreductase subunit beta
VVNLNEGFSADELWVHDEKDFFKAQMLIRMFDNPAQPIHFPRPFGVFYETERPCYDDILSKQLEEVTAKKGSGNLDKLLRGNEVWEIV